MIQDLHSRHCTIHHLVYFLTADDRQIPMIYGNIYFPELKDTVYPKGILHADKILNTVDKPKQWRYVVPEVRPGFMFI